MSIPEVTVLQLCNVCTLLYDCFILFSVIHPVFGIILLTGRAELITCIQDTSIIMFRFCGGSSGSSIKSLRYKIFGPVVKFVAYDFYFKSFLLVFDR